MYDSLPRADSIITTKAGIVSLLLNLDVEKSPGPDNIPNAFLKLYAELVADYLLILFNFSINFGVVPPDSKCAKVTPIHKTGSQLIVSNYGLLY